MVLATENKLNNREHPSVSLVCGCGLYPQFGHPKYSLMHLYLLGLVTTKEIGFWLGQLNASESTFSHPDDVYTQLGFIFLYLDSYTQQDIFILQ
jgi:hypothetical protein